MLGTLKRLTNKGDTIVEVMIVLSILGLAISISYSTANISLSDARQAQEASEAAVLVKSQLEGLRVMTGYSPFLADGVTSNPDYIFGLLPGQQFCVNYSGGAYHVVKITGPGICFFPPRYNIAITNPAVGSNTYNLTASWDDVQGQGTDTSTTLYRLYKP